MKKILLPTDFSEDANNALRYGLKIADKTGAEVLFFHANHVPIITPETPVGLYETVISEADSRKLEELMQLKDTLFNELSINPDKVKATCLVKPGFAVDTIIDLANKEKAGLIVMGTKGASGIAKILMGSNTASVIKKATCPVLAIPNNIHFHGIEKIVLATDFHEVDDKKTLEPLLEMALLFNSELLIFNVREGEEMPTVSQAEEGLRLETTLKPITHSYHFSENGNVIDGIEEFVEKSSADLLVLIPHKLNLFEELFTSSTSKELALHAKLPLLTLPEKML